MKIGILTHHYVKNYGAFLQMKALYETLKHLYPDADIKIIDYVVRKHWSKNILHVLHYRPRVDTVATYMRKIKQLAIFSQYERKLPRTETVRNEAEINKLGLDMIILGSDEIWNVHGAGYHPMKFGTGLHAEILTAYAPSVGSVTEASQIPDEVRSGIQSIDRISGRDNETVKFIERISGRKAALLPDPTFLYDFDRDIEREKIRPKDFPYILVYDCKLTKKMTEQLRAYADRNGQKIIGAGDYKRFYDEGDINLTPYEWVSLFRHAEKVVTGTFHGTVFAVKYRKDLVCYPTEKNRINKILSLLKNLNMEKRLIHVGEEKRFEALLEQRTDYQPSEAYLESKKKEAEAFLLGEYGG